MALHLVPVTFAQASAHVEQEHRHHRPPPGHKFSLGVSDEDGVLRGVAIVGRPVARGLQDGRTLEVTRTATDGTRNANSMLYGAAWRAAKALGYVRMITYTQDGESGASLRAAGWRPVAHCPPRPGWNCPSRPRAASGNDNIARTRWEISSQ
ncbi:XF1762 family protein [Streptosporangium sp. OZ121]|uniref:XF1762 family protein n=1 Tax=Streptosporangium sp. OZ121 TaxID=3444183 RepID=UPI003F78E886